MIIDFHTHMFPKQIAESTITYLAEFSGLTPSTDGSREGLLKSCEHAGIDHAVVLPVMTKPSQYVRILQRMPLDEEEKEKIFSKNARKLLTL